MNNKKHPNRRFQHILSIPFIWMILIPALFIDLSVEIYHQICFRLYDLPLIKRSSYIKIDRHKIKSLNCIDKVNCAYCGYVNGLFHYLTAVGAETEKYWCGIKHKPSKNFKEPDHHKNFLPYDEEIIKKEIKERNKS